ncbi:MAG: hypothetical protein R3C09_07190 [Pirellulaceae bacterium]
MKYLQELKLSSPQSIGMCFATWLARAKRHRSSSNSGVSDDTLVHVKNLMPLEWLDLSHTASPDDLSHTAVTDAGMRTWTGHNSNK